MTTTPEHTEPDVDVVLIDDLSPEQRLEIIGELLQKLAIGSLPIAGEISCEDIELLAFAYGLAGLPDEGIELSCAHSELDPDD